MNTTSKCIKEGNPIVEALGSGFQSIMIRTYKPSPVGKQFLIFPTSFYKKLDIDNTFQEDYHEFARENIEPFKTNNKTEIKYYATVEYVIEDNKIPIDCFEDFHIWKNVHVKKYLGKKLHTFGYYAYTS